MKRATLTLSAAALPLAIALAAPAIGQPVPAQLPGRLPPEVTPLHYAIMVDPDAKALSFAGSETVTINVLRPTATIMMNAAELSVAGVMLDGKVAPTSATVNEAAQTLTIAFANPLSVGQHLLAMTFRGKINRSAAGLFAVDYKDAAGDQRMLVTQFEAADGRRFAPMWDEPAAKATFTLTAATPKGQTSFSNMPIASTKPGANSKTLVTFADTPKMSSYLLFLGQGNVERKTKMVGKTEIGIITRKGALAQGDYALDLAAKVLAYYNDYFGVPYPLPKMDMIAAPGSSQFFSAMENWGAILYFDRAVLVDPKLTSESGRQQVFNTVSHEMAHQWFGDLVTMSWWDDLWLNEGFASWMAGKVSNDLNPDWHVAAQDAAFSRQGAIQTDARSSTHPIVQKISTPDEVSSAFDAITYQKGQAVIRMLEGVVGPDAFRSGVRSYMAKHKYGNTSTDDLWTEVSAAAGRPVKPFMDTFTLQPGVPLVRVAEPACAGATARLSYMLGRFGLDEPSKKPLNWIVPVEASAGAAQANVDLTSGKPAVASIGGGCAAPAIVNPGQFGYYRTLYAPGHFTKLAANFGTLGLSDQVGLLNDNLSLANGEYSSVGRYFTLVDAMPATGDPLVWRLAASQLLGIYSNLEGDPAQAGYAAKVRTLLAPQLARTGRVAQPGEPASISQLRETLVAILGRVGDPGIVGEARRYAADFARIPANVRDAVLSVYAYNATPAEWERLHQAARTERDPGAQRIFWEVLGTVKDEVLARKALAIALSDETTVPNRANLIEGVASEHPAMAFDWAVAHADTINANVEASARPRYIPALAGASSDAAVADRVAAFSAKAYPAQSQQPTQSVVATIRYRARLRGIQAGPAAAWASKQ